MFTPIPWCPQENATDKADRIGLKTDDLLLLEKGKDRFPQKEECPEIKHDLPYLKPASLKKYNTESMV